MNSKHHQPHQQQPHHHQPHHHQPHQPHQQAMGRQGSSSYGRLSGSRTTDSSRPGSAAPAYAIPQHTPSPSALAQRTWEHHGLGTKGARPPQALTPSASASLLVPSDALAGPDAHDVRSTGITSATLAASASLTASAYPQVASAPTLASKATPAARRLAEGPASPSGLKPTRRAAAQAPHWGRSQTPPGLAGYGPFDFYHQGGAGGSGAGGAGGSTAPQSGTLLPAKNRGGGWRNTTAAGATRGASASALRAGPPPVATGSRAERALRAAETQGNVSVVRDGSSAVWLCGSATAS